MCAQFDILSDLSTLSKKYSIQVPEDLPNFGSRISPHTLAPVILGAEKLKVVAMEYSMVPAWSKTAQVKFATHNARVETIAEKPTWKKPFLTKRCLVPISRFIEPIYEGEFAGHMVAFSASNEDVMLAAGVWDEWLDKESGEVKQSFAIITSQPSSFIEKTGHDRMPIFINKNNYSKWLSSKNLNYKQLLTLLHEIESINFKVDSDRLMKPGWEKRI